MSSFDVLSGLSGLPLHDQIILSQFGQGLQQQVPYSKVHEAFEHNVDSHPDSIAAVFDHKGITYQELDVAANQLANQLIASGLEPRERVCLVVSRSLEMLVGIFAILKAGCQYVPVDGGVASDKQIAHIFHDTGARHILCLPKFQERVELFANAGTCITQLGPNQPLTTSKERPVVQCDSTDGCYAIYTSGKFLPMHLDFFDIG